MPRLYPGAVWLPAPGPWDPVWNRGHFEAREAGPTVLLIAHHTTVDLASTIATFTDPGGFKSAHLTIARDDPVNTVYQFVDLDLAAFHAGDLNVNWISWGVETVRTWGQGPGTDGYQPITPGQYRRWHEVAAWFAQLAGLPLDRNFLLPHRAIVPDECPGDLDLDRIITGGTDLPLDPSNPVDKQLLDDVAFIKGRIGGDSGNATLTQDMQSLWAGHTLDQAQTPWPAWLALKAAIGGVTGVGPVQQLLDRLNQIFK